MCRVQNLGQQNAGGVWAFSKATVLSEDLEERRKDMLTIWTIDWLTFSLNTWELNWRGWLVYQLLILGSGILALAHVLVTKEYFVCRLFGFTFPSNSDIFPLLSSHVLQKVSQIAGHWTEWRVGRLYFLCQVLWRNADMHLKIENKLIKCSYVTSVGRSKPNVNSA